MTATIRMGHSDLTVSTQASAMITARPQVPKMTALATMRDLVQGVGLGGFRTIL